MKGRPPPSKLAQLQALTRVQCEEEFERRLGQPFLVRGVMGPFALLVHDRFTAERDRRATEDEAREIYEHARKAAARGTLPGQREKIQRFVDADPHGGTATMSLLAVATSLARGAPPLKLDKLSETEDKHYRLGLEHLGRGDGFSELVWTTFAEAQRPPWHFDLSNRDGAIIAILLGEAPDWGAYSLRLSKGKPVTAAIVIREVEARVRKLMGSDAAAKRTR